MSEYFTGTAYWRRVIENRSLGCGGRIAVRADRALDILFFYVAFSMGYFCNTEFRVYMVKMTFSVN